MGKNKKIRICIIGAGAAGISAALFLKRKGYSRITVLEKNGYVGGMCYSEKKYGMANGMGAIAITPDYKNVIKLSKKYGLDLNPGPENVLLDYKTGFQYTLKHILGNESRARFFTSVMRYYLYILKYRKYVSRPGFRKPCKEITVSCKTWLQEKGMENLENLLSIPVTCFGYGHLDEIPALYVLKYLNFWNFSTLLYVGMADVLGFRPRWSKRLTNGLQDLVQIMSDEVGDVRKGIIIKKITRKSGPDGLIKIDYINEESRGKHVLECDRLIIAMCPTITNLGFLDITQEEKNVFGHVKHNSYYTIACEIKSFSYNYFLQLLNNRTVEFPPDGYPCMISKVWDECDIVIFYSYSRNPANEKEIIRKFKENVNTINRELVKILEVKKWDYFPHFSTSSLQHGLYHRLEDLQGQNNTYYTGGLLNFELVENVMAYSRHLVNKYF